MNKDKSIKDLKELNDKLKNQLEYSKIRINHLEYELKHKEHIIDELVKYYHIKRTNIITSKKLEIYGEEGIRASTRYVIYNEILDKIKELENDN